MPGFNTLPAVGGGGGQANMTYVASIHMETYNRTWAQGGTPGYYAMYSTNQENGYVYFVGATTTGGPLNRLINVTHAFTSINIIAPTNDMVSLYKAKVKSTTEFPNPFAAFASFPSIITSSGNFVLPNNALPLVNVLLVGGGGQAFHHGGGGGGGNVVKLTAYQAVGTTACTVGSHGAPKGGDTYFGNVYALGGGAAGLDNSANGNSGGNGGGASSHNTSLYTGGSGSTQTTSTGLGTAGAPVFHGGFAGGNAKSPSSRHVGGSGAGAAGNGISRIDSNGGVTGGAGHYSDFVSSGNFVQYGAGGSGSDHHGNSSAGNASPIRYNGHTASYGSGQNSYYNSTGDGHNGAVILRYYIP